MAALGLLLPTLLLPLLLLLLLPPPAPARPEPPACKIRITSKALELVKLEGLRFLEQELMHIDIPDLRGGDGNFYYNITDVKVERLQVTESELSFRPPRSLALQISNASIRLGFRRQLLYWFFYDGGRVDASAEGVNIRTALHLARGPTGRVQVANVSCKASVAKMHTGFGGTYRKVYEILSSFITSGMRFLLNQQICPALHHAGVVLLNSMLETIPVRGAVDDHVGIDYSLLRDPASSDRNLDMDFRGAFFPWPGGNVTLKNRAVSPVVVEENRMVYVAFSEFFFDSAMDSYFRAGTLALELTGAEIPKDVDVMLRAFFFGAIILLEARLDAKMALRGKTLQTKLDLRRFRVSSNQSALEALALLPLQAPLKTILQIAVMPLLHARTRRGVRIPLPEGIDFVREVVTNYAGFLTIGADLRFSEGLREVIEKNRRGPGPDAPDAPSAPPPGPVPPRPL
ncbi:phospholipid transfer protein isoform X2 [Ornithorhynchus anatinus]|uniref:phospholipid transfer protein isoform X2 n=1 Tax=Ornithorhynchus anatinus TaxID=9258 RepID=UPI0010A895FD|nr:phospholipid transfer protein isoform X2 [Ornithorhynchus anatinus]